MAQHFENKENACSSMSSNKEHGEMAKMIETLKRQVDKMEQQLIEKDMKINWLVTRNDDLESEINEMKKLHGRRTEIFFNAVNGLSSSKKIVEQLNKEVKQLRAEKNEKAIEKRHETLCRQKFERNAKHKFLNAGEKIISNIFEADMALPPPPHIMEKIIAKIHRAFAPLPLIWRDESSGSDVQEHKSGGSEETTDDCSVPSSSLMSPVQITMSIPPPPHILEQPIANADPAFLSMQTSLEKQESSQDQTNPNRAAPTESPDLQLSSSQVSPVDVGDYLFV